MGKQSQTTKQLKSTIKKQWMFLKTLVSSVLFCVRDSSGNPFFAPLFDIKKTSLRCSKDVFFVW
ncbi:hypothetical protein B0A58_06090 [Flavobacterium branchiophilum NBRC 15030 = ATCC 35035]|nr:hypothetical protein B0A58_06090 [Flavobacterium branchiophilum NBRC 15030 = ATCC 35035]